MSEDKFMKIMKKYAKKVPTLQVSVSSQDKAVNYRYSTTTIDQAFHSASVGKLMTTVLIFRVVDASVMTLESKISEYIAPVLLENLFVIDGIDYRHEVTIRQLLSHTSGVNDYFESENGDGSSFIDTITKNQTRFWTPEALVQYTQKHQQAIAKPGERFLYSDTGFVLLGLALEAIYAQSFSQLLQAQIFQPLHMYQSYLSFYDERFNAEILAPLFVNGVDLHEATSLSCDFSGGGIVTTVDDLQRFLKALQADELMSKVSRELMETIQHKYHQGIHYGTGMMELHFGEFFFLLKNLPKLKGHLGITGVHAWYDSNSGATYVINVGDSTKMEVSFRLLIALVQLIRVEM